MYSSIFYPRKGVCPERCVYAILPFSTSSPLKNQPMKQTCEGEKGDGLFEASDESHSPHPEPAYIPTAVEK